MEKGFRLVWRRALGVCGEGLVWRMACVENGLCGEWLVWRMACVEKGLCGEGL